MTRKQFLLLLALLTSYESDDEQYNDLKQFARERLSSRYGVNNCSLAEAYTRLEKLA